MMQRLAEKARDQREWNVPNWALWVGSFLIFLTLGGLIYGAVQHVRVGRWAKLLDKSQQAIVTLRNANTHLKAQVSSAHSDGTGQATSRALLILDKKAKAVEDKRKQAQKQKEGIKQTVDQLDVDGLLNEYRKEGFPVVVVVKPARDSGLAKPEPVKSGPVKPRIGKSEPGESGEEVSERVKEGQPER